MAAMAVALLAAQQFVPVRLLWACQIAVRVQTRKVKAFDRLNMADEQIAGPIDVVRA